MSYRYTPTEYCGEKNPHSTWTGANCILKAGPHELHKDGQGMRWDADGLKPIQYAVDSRAVFTIHRGGCQHLHRLDEADVFWFESTGTTREAIELDGDEAVGEPQDWQYAPCLPALHAAAGPGERAR
jgi:hypothetical protein